MEQAQIEQLEGRELDLAFAEFALSYRWVTGWGWDYNGVCETSTILVPPSMTDKELNSHNMPARGKISPGYFVKHYSEYPDLVEKKIVDKGLERQYGDEVNRRVGYDADKGVSWLIMQASPLLKCRAAFAVLLKAKQINDSS